LNMKLKKHIVDGKTVQAGTHRSALRKARGYVSYPGHHVEECAEGTPNCARVEDGDGKFICWVVEVEHG